MGVVEAPENKSVEFFRCALRSTSDSEHINPTPDLDEMQDWCFKNLGDNRDFEGNIVWVFAPSMLTFTFATEENALAFILAFRTA